MMTTMTMTMMMTTINDKSPFRLQGSNLTLNVSLLCIYKAAVFVLLFFLVGGYGHLRQDSSLKTSASTRKLVTAY
jgi:hypothetical protein